MSDTKHTPGPWLQLVARTMVHIRNASGVLVASLPYKNEEDKANARLVAASPDLLEALKAVAPYLSAGDRLVALAAIAKAEGR